MEHKKAYLYLPDGKCFQIAPTEEGAFDENEKVMAFLDRIANSTALKLNVSSLSNDVNTILLWGNTLKNSYIVVE